MIRTQISLDEKEYRLAKKSAKQQGISVAEYVRRAIRQTLTASRDPKPWMKYAGMVETGDPNSSQTIDDVVYGSKD
jgi:Ribbon-helix-helix protein, copG family